MIYIVWAVGGAMVLGIVVAIFYVLGSSAIPEKMADEKKGEKDAPEKAADKPPRKKPMPVTSIVEVTQQNGLIR